MALKWTQGGQWSVSPTQQMIDRELAAEMALARRQPFFVSPTQQMIDRELAAEMARARGGGTLRFTHQGGGDWTNRPLWQYRPGGPGPLAGVPYESWPDYLDQLDAALPWAQLAQGSARDAWQRELEARRMDEARRQWEAEFAAGRTDRNFANWLALQQLNMQRDQMGADNAWRWRELELRDRDAQEQMRLARDRLAAELQQQGWSNEFAQREADRQWQQWQNEFQARRDDAMWNRGWQERQLGEDTRRWDLDFGEGKRRWDLGFGEDTRRWDLDFGQRKAMEDWTRAFQEAQFDWRKQRAGEEDALQRELTAMSTFGRRFGPNISAM